MRNFDVHVATEGQEDRRLKRMLERMYFTDDQLTERGVTFLPNEGAWASSCPLIGLHMTNKDYDNRSSVEGDVDFLQRLLIITDQVGYTHAEVIAKDTTIMNPQKYFDQRSEWPVQKFDAELGEANKKWDLHVTVPKDAPPELHTVLSYENSGLYYIDLLKRRNGEEREFRVYTIQGRSHPKEGHQLYGILEQWFNENKAPHVEMKLEVTLDMVRVGNPRIVPPTISQVRYR